MGRWVLVRHGVTSWNEEGRVQGHVQTALSAAGRRQAGQAASRLAGISFDAAYASDLLRCVETAETILSELQVPLQRTSALREQGYGEWEGRVFQEIKRDEPDRYDTLMKHPTDFVPPGGEGIPALLERVGSFVATAREAHGPDETLLIVGHMGSIQALVVCLLGLPKNFITRFMLRPASVSIMGIYPDRATLEEWNSTGHLEEAS